MPVMTSQRQTIHLLFPLLLVVAAAAAASPFPASNQPTTHLYPIAETNRSPVELLTLDSLAGFLARDTPRLFRVATADWQHNTQDSYSLWLSQLILQGVTVDNSLLTSNLTTILQTFVPTAPRFIQCDATNESVSVAITLAAASDSLLLIAGDDATTAVLTSMHAVLTHDVRHQLVDDAITSKVLSNLSRSVFVFQDPSKSQFLADWSIYARASNMPWNSSSTAQQNALERVVDHGAAFGWGPENDYVSTLNHHGIWVHASDYNKNFPALANGKKSRVAPSLPPPPPPPPLPPPTTTPPAKHTVAFMMTDGDNLQWTLGPWSTANTWYGSSTRGAFPMGWTLSPSIADLAPSALSYFFSTKTNNDEFVAGPSGYGYMYPTTLPLSNITGFSTFTFDAMASFQMTTMNVLGQNDAAPNCTLLKEYQSHLPNGMVYYSWGDGYSGLHGKVWSCQGKPIVSGKWSLWGNSTDTTSDMVGVAAMVEKLLGVQDDRDGSKLSGYTFVPVHAWSHSYEDVVSIVKQLDKELFDVVLPSELLRRVRLFVKEGVVVL